MTAFPDKRATTSVCSALAGICIASGLVAQVPADPASIPGISHLWRAEGNGQDAVGSEHLNVGAGVTFVPGPNGGTAFRFPGLAGVLVSNTNAPLRHIRNSFTTAFWVRPEGNRASTGQTIRGFTGAADQQYAIYPDHGGDDLVGGAGSGVSVGMNGVSVAEHRFAYVPTPLVWNGSINGWTHVAVVYDRYVPILYVNGKRVQTGLDTDLRSVITPGDIFPSKTFGSVNGYGPFSGALDDVAIFSRVLTPDEIGQLAGLAPPAATPPRLLNVNFGVDLTPSRIGPAATGFATNDFWNLYSRDNGAGGIRANGTLTDARWSDSLPSTIDLLVENAAGASVNDYPDSMMGIFLQPSPPIGTIRVTLQDLPVGRYTLLAYGHGASDAHNTVFTVQSAGLNLGNRATANTSAWKSPTWTEGAQYVSFPSFFVDSTRSFVLTASRGSGSTPALNGLQLVFEDATPLAFVPAQPLFTNVTDIAILKGIAGSEIRYTLEGSEPTASSTLYSGPIRLTAAAEIKARLFSAGQPVSPVITSTFRRVYALNDGISAAWREQFFGPDYLTDPRVAAEADPDQDGANNSQEFVNKSNPLDPLSGFAVQVRLVPSITWTSVPGAKYRVLRKDAIDIPEWTEIRQITPEGASATFTDDTVADLPRFYLIEAVRP
jgi:hypothetical protein